MSFKFTTSDDQGEIYAVQMDGTLLFNKDLARNGTKDWAFGAGQPIGTAWADFLHVFSGGDGIIYAVKPTGELMFYRDLTRDGTFNWAFGGLGQQIGTGWANFLHVFSGGDGIIYAVQQTGELMFYRDLARDGTFNWANGGVGQQIDSGWASTLRVFSGGNGVIYAVNSNGDLMYHRDLARDGTANWEHGGQGQQISSGWQQFSAVFSGGLGIIYAITPDGSFLYYRDLAQDGTTSWEHNGIAQVIDSGWFVYDTKGPLAGYCVPLSGAPGEDIDFKIHAPTGCSVRYLRLKQQPDGSVGVPMDNPIDVGQSVQAKPPDAWESGCGWLTTLTLQIPTGWSSGMYAAECTDSSGLVHYIVFIVKPALGSRGDFAILANTNTWNAYNDWGGRSKYSTPPGATLSFARPNPATSPVGTGINHLTRAELWVLGWMEDAGYEVDVYADRDLHDGIPSFSSYKALVLSTHPEYWSIQMMQHLEEYLANNGCALYLAGNGLFENVEFNAAGDALSLLNGDPATDRAECYFRNLSPPRSERALLGVAYRYDNYMTFAPFEVRLPAHRFFNGTGLALYATIGETGNNGAASGWEMDTSIAGIAASGAIVGATSASDDRGAPPAGLDLLARGTNSGYGADMTCYETAAGGFVFAAGSLSFGGSLVNDPMLQAIVVNVLDECLGR